MRRLDQSATHAAQFCAAMSAAGIDKPLVAAAMTVVGEAGEMVEALRRHLGYARRVGSIEEVAGELADVELSAHVYSHRAGVVWSTAFNLALGEGEALGWVQWERQLQPSVAGLLVSGAASYFGELAAKHAFHRGIHSPIGSGLAPQILALAVLRNRNLAEIVGIDLGAAVEAKAGVIMSRPLDDRLAD